MLKPVFCSAAPQHPTFTFSPDPEFGEKLLEVVGLYMKPSDNAVEPSGDRIIRNEAATSRAPAGTSFGIWMEDDRSFDLSSSGWLVEIAWGVDQSFALVLELLRVVSPNSLNARAKRVSEYRNPLHVFRRPGLQETSDKAGLTIPLKGPVTKLVSLRRQERGLWRAARAYDRGIVISVRPGSIHRRHHRTDGLRISGLP